MQIHFKNNRGTIGLDISEVKVKKKMYATSKAGSAGNAPAGFKKVCVMWDVKIFLSPMTEDKERWRQ